MDTEATKVAPCVALSILRPGWTVQTLVLVLNVPRPTAIVVVLSGWTEVSVTVTKPPVATVNANVIAPLVLMVPVKVSVTPGVGVGVGMVGLLSPHAADVTMSAVTSQRDRTDRRRMHTPERVARGDAT